ncbi:MAG: hypothetical protein AAFM92_15210 [Pseudomonadota bacterium]
MMSQAIREDLQRQENKRKSEGKKKILEDIKKMAPGASKEKLAKLQKGIDKHISFSEAGGDVDYVLPPSLSADEADKEISEVVEELRQVIQVLRGEKQQMRLLEYKEADVEDDDV